MTPPRKPLVEIEFGGEQTTLSHSVWPALRENLIRWHLTGAAELRRSGGEIVDPMALHAVDELLTLTWLVYDVELAQLAARQYLQG